MDRLEKYYSGFTCNDDPGRGSALAALSALCRGDSRNGDIFIMYSDDFMKRYLEPDDYQFWIDQKQAFAC